MVLTQEKQTRFAGKEGRFIHDHHASSREYHRIAFVLDVSHVVVRQKDNAQISLQSQEVRNVMDHVQIVSLDQDKALKVCYMSKSVEVMRVKLLQAVAFKKFLETGKECKQLILIYFPL